MRKMREESNAELCPVCSKQVFQAEKLVVEEKTKKKKHTIKHALNAVKQIVVFN